MKNTGFVSHFSYIKKDFSYIRTHIFIANWLQWHYNLLYVFRRCPVYSMTIQGMCCSNREEWRMLEALSMIICTTNTFKNVAALEAKKSIRRYFWWAKGIWLFYQCFQDTASTFFPSRTICQWIHRWYLNWIDENSPSPHVSYLQNFIFFLKVGLTS